MIKLFWHLWVFGIQYPKFKIMLITGAVSAMIVSDLIAILFGKFLSKKISEATMQTFSGILFLIFGFVGLFDFIF